TQSFILHVDSIYPAEYYIFSNLEDFTQISPDNGEDEFILSDHETQVSNVTTSAGTYSSRFTFSFSAPRHLDYYMFRIFVPVLLIILVSWVTFFLKDYRHRIEIASANLLLFIAFSFSLADNYPRLGYMTFLDAIMAIMFVVNSLVIVYNVWLKRLEMNDEAVKADRIDSIMDWAYPLLYLVLLAGLVWVYFYRV
ncbi:MAG: electron transporter RnfC, partial [Chloroflexi bacterium]|nr:electron transporter RnfC [Chloroflexota bacterium]